MRPADGRWFRRDVMFALSRRQPMAWGFCPSRIRSLRTDQDFAAAASVRVNRLRTAVLFTAPLSFDNFPIRTILLLSRPRRVFVRDGIEQEGTGVPRVGL
jgi:hypothetical protein